MSSSRFWTTDERLSEYELISVHDRLERRSIAVPSGCIEFQGATNPGGYGRLGVGSRTHGTRRVILAHRAAWIVAHERPLPARQIVMHRCDNPRCVNPEHLVAGTFAENTEDMRTKGRDKAGNHAEERNGRAKLDRDSVTAIRGRRAAGASQAAIAREFGITQSHVSQIVRALVWANVV